jgi:hypothetical protein
MLVGDMMARDWNASEDLGRVGEAYLEVCVKYGAKNMERNK